MKKRIVPKKVWKPVGPYSHAIKVTNSKAIVFVAGQIPVNERGILAGTKESGDTPFRNHAQINLEAQVRQTLQNVKNVLKDAGATMSDIVRLNTYVVASAMNEYRRVGTEVRKEFFRNTYPPGATFSVVSLMPPEALIEIEAIAVVD